MKIKLNTVKFNEMLSRALKCASYEKSIPLTTMIGIKLSNNKLCLHTTDMSNHLLITLDDVEGDDFDITVRLEVLSKLIPKITSEFIILDITDDSLLKITGNGEYVIELEIDEEEGELLHFPNYVFEDNNNRQYEIYSSDISTILATNKSALYNDSKEVFSNYYVGKRVISTDRITLCSYERNLFKDENVLLSPKLVDLLNALIEDTIYVTINDDNQIMFSTDTTTVYGLLEDGVEDYPIDVLDSLLDIDVESSCKVPKQAIINSLDRISLFINEFDNKAIKLVFSDRQLHISSMQLNGIESVTYLECDNVVDYECITYIDSLLQQVKSVSGDKVTIKFGNDTCIKIDDGDVTKIISLIEDNN